MKTDKLLLGLLILAILIRVGIILFALTTPERAIQHDTHTYIEFAQAIVEGRGWEYPSAIRTPGYPFFLAIFNGGIVLQVIAQTIVGICSIWVTYLIGKMLFDKKIAMLACILLAIGSESITHSYYLLTETLFTFLFVVSTYFLIKAHSAQGINPALIAGIFLGLSILTRPSIVIFLVVGAMVLLWDYSMLRERLMKAFVYLIACCLVVAPWVVRNKIVLGLWTVSTISNSGLYFYNAASYDANRSGKNEDVIKQEFETRLITELAARKLENTEANRDVITGELAKQIIFSDPLGYSIIHLKNDINNFLPDTDLLEIIGVAKGEQGTLNIIKQQGLIAGITHYFSGNFGLIIFLLPSIGILAITYIGWVIGTFMTILRRQFYSMLILSLPIFYGLLLPGSPSNSRFRVPVMPFMTLLAAYGLFYLIKFVHPMIIKNQN